MDAPPPARTVFRAGPSANPKSSADESDSAACQTNTLSSLRKASTWTCRRPGHLLAPAVANRSQVSLLVHVIHDPDAAGSFLHRENQPITGKRTGLASPYHPLGRGRRRCTGVLD